MVVRLLSLLATAHSSTSAPPTLPATSSCQTASKWCTWRQPEVDVELISKIAMEEGLRFAVREGGRTVGSGIVTKSSNKDSIELLSARMTGPGWLSPNFTSSRCSDPERRPIVMAKDKREHVVLVCSRNRRPQLLHQPQPYGPEAGADEVQPTSAPSHLHKEKRRK